MRILDDSGEEGADTGEPTASSTSSPPAGPRFHYHKATTPRRRRPGTMARSRWATSVTSTSDGYLFITDRVSDMVLHDGVNVLPARDRRRAVHASGDGRLCGARNGRRAPWRVAAPSRRRAPRRRRRPTPSQAHVQRAPGRLQGPIARSSTWTSCHAGPERQGAEAVLREQAWTGHDRQIG